MNYLEKSYAVYIKNIRPLLAGSFIILLFMAAMLSLALVLIFQDPVSALSQNLSPYSYQLNGTPMVIAGALIILFTAAFGIVLQTGMYGMAIESLSKKTSLKTMAKTLRSRWAVAISSFIMLIAIYICVFLLFIIVPAAITAASDTLVLWAAILFSILVIFLLSVFFSFVYPAVVSGKGAYASIVSSFNTAKRDYIGTFLVVVFFIVFSFLIRIVAGLIPFVGTFIGMIITFIIIVPWETTTFSYMYKKLGKGARRR